MTSIAESARELAEWVMEEFGATAEAGWTYAEMRNAIEPLESRFTTALESTAKSAREDERTRLVAIIEAVNPSLRWGSANGSFMKKAILAAISDERESDGKI